MLLSALVCLALTSCHRDIQNEDAVKRGVMDYLATRQGLNIASMNVSVKSMVFRENQADVTVIFTPRNSNAAQPMSIPYTLEKKGDRWVVKPHGGGGQSPHGGMGGAVGGGMGASPHGGGMGRPAGGASPAGALPPGHPTVPPRDSGSK